jgi:exodeoxyribonuclease-5
MEFSPQQDRALKAVDRWYKQGDSQVFYLAGYAGTGKTTLAKHLAEGIGDVMFAAYTGKAAHVLRNKGCDGASTIHSLIYRSRDKSKAHLDELNRQLAVLREELRELPPKIFEQHPKVRRLIKEIDEETENVSQPMFSLNTESIVKDLDLLVIDECSMVDERMGEHLLSFKTPILVLGDPAQLPPPGGAGYFTETQPDFMLDEVHRQAAESPILRMATKVRNGESLEIGDWGEDCHVIPKGVKLSPEQVLSFDQLLVGKNVTRHATNMKVRKLHDIHEKYPVIGDRLVCLRNNTELGLLNGAIFNVTDVTDVLDGKVHMSVRPEDSMESVDVAALEHHFLGRGEELKKQYWLKSEGQEFDYGYALTVHKSQGSQWDSVGIFDESGVFRQHRNRWLYTAITRAAEKVSVIRM